VGLGGATRLGAGETQQLAIAQGPGYREEVKAQTAPAPVAARVPGPGIWSARLLGICALVACATPQPVPQSVPGGEPPPPATGLLADSVHVALGVPDDGSPSDDVLLDHSAFVLSYNPQRRVPNWVAWRLTGADLGEVPRSNHFHEDPLLPEIYPRVLPTDFGGSGFERGHMCPSGDRTASRLANDATFVMSNMQPQVHALNAGPWERLEQFERKLAREGKVLYLVAGGLFQEPSRRLRTGISVPSASFKVVVSLHPGQDRPALDHGTKTFAVVMPNDDSIARTQWTSHLTTIDEVERQSGYDLLSAVEPGLQEALERRPPARPN
jgi:endonuclease G